MFDVIAIELSINDVYLVNSKLVGKISLSLRLCAVKVFNFNFLTLAFLCQ